LFVSREHADQKRSNAHDHERENEHRLASNAISEVTDDDSSERPCDKTHGIGGQGRKPSDKRIKCGKEDLVEDQRCGGSIEEEVVPLNRGANEARQTNETDRAGFGLRHDLLPHYLTAGGL
jgi:hypothetical protein